jgi:AcrR family transcriptional regulator
MPDPAETPADGRHARSHASRGRIVRALLDLVAEGDPSPGAEQVAARAGVGLRSVFRHFRDMDSLYREMSHTIENEIAAVVRHPFQDAGWREQLQEMVERRATVFERLSPFLRAASVNRHRSTALDADYRSLAELARANLRRVLAAAALDPSILEMLDLVLSFEAWSRLRQDQNLSLPQAKAAVQTAVRLLIEP